MLNTEHLLLKDTQAVTSVKVDSLAKLYLEGNSAEISNETIALFCDWLWDEYQNLSLNVQFSWYQRYNSADEMFADIEQSHLWVAAENYDMIRGITPVYNFILQAIHDHDHYLTNSDFTMAGEIATYRATAKRAPSLDIQKILYSQSVLRSAAHIFLGHAPISKTVFP